MTRVGIITQARTTSTRLQRKVLIEVGGTTLLDHHLDRLEASHLPVFVATTINLSDDEIVAVASRRGVGVFRGSESDVLSRFEGCAIEHGLDVIVRVTSDCPLADGQLIKTAVEEYLAAGDPYLYLSNTLKRTFPRGFDFEVFSAEALTEAETYAAEPEQREHVTPYLYGTAAHRMTLRNVAWHEDKSAYRVTLDTADDLAMIRALIEDFGAASMSCGEIIRLLDKHPELVAMNAHVEQKRLGE